MAVFLPNAKVVGECVKWFLNKEGDMWEDGGL